MTSPDFPEGHPVISLLLRTDHRRETGELDRNGSPVIEVVRATRETVDLDDLTPRARTLAEAIAQQEQSPAPMGLREIQLECGLTNAATFPRRADEVEAYGMQKQQGQPARHHFVRSPLWATSEMSGAEYLERQARSWPMAWYVVGAAGCGPVPSFEAGKADRVYTHDTARERLGLSPLAWDLLTKAKHLPAPDRWAHGRPHWYPETVDSYRDREVELWSVSRIAQHLGYEGKSAAGTTRSQLSRWGLSAAGRAAGRGGESLYAADQVQALHAHRPGRGRHGAARAGGKFAASSDGPGF